MWMALSAVLFDVDGTLLDTNAVHVEAWLLAFESLKYRVGRDRIQEEIGKGGDKLVPAILGQKADHSDGDKLRKTHGEEFSRLAKEKGLKPFPHALELLAAVRARQLKVALATSSTKKMLRVLAIASGIELAGVCDLMATADDSAESKPAPDIVAAAVAKLGMSPAQCAMVGDTHYDMHAAKHAGVVGIGVLTGYQTQATLLHSGARVVFKDAAELRKKLDEALRLVSPAAIHATAEVLESLMREALNEAQRGYDSGELPIGCVLADGSGQIVARGYHQGSGAGSPDRTAHAELVTLRSSAGQVPPESRDCMLVTTVEPCVMCTGAAMEVAVDTIVFGMPAPAHSGTGRVEPPDTVASQMPRIVGGVLAKQSRALFKSFAAKTKNPAQREFAEQLLAVKS